MSSTENHAENEFRHFCGKDIQQFQKEQNGERKSHLFARISTQMYYEACRLGYNENTVCSMLHNDLNNYTKLSSKVVLNQFERLSKDLGLKFDPLRWKPSIKLEKLSTANECNGNCQADAVSDKDIAAAFNVASNNKSKETSTSAFTHTTNNPKKATDTVQPYGTNSTNDVIKFDLNFKKSRKLNEPQTSYANTTNTPYYMQTGPSTSTGSTTTNQLPNFHKKTYSTDNVSRVQPTSSWASSYRPTYGNKRKFPGDDNEDNYSSPYQPYGNKPPQSDEKNKTNFDFKTGQEELETQYDKKYGLGTAAGPGAKKSLGGRRTIQSKFVSPLTERVDELLASLRNTSSVLSSSTTTSGVTQDDRLKNIEPKMIERIRNEIMDTFAPVSWDDIAGLEYAKNMIKEAVVYPILRPDIFTGLRRPPRGILLFGPPGTGKTLIGKCIASQSESTFFSISASCLTSKWVGEGEKMVRALFAVAKCHQPAVVFIDEIDSLLCQRSEREMDCTRKIKTEFLVQLDGAATSADDRILIVGATNRPQELDEAARRRLTKRLYIPLPELPARIQILNNLLRSERAEISEKEIQEIGRLTDGFSGADMHVLCHEASMGPVRSIPSTQMNLINANDVRAVNYGDFQAALNCVRSSVAQRDLKQYLDWDKTYGSGIGK